MYFYETRIRSEDLAPHYPLNSIFTSPSDSSLTAPMPCLHLHSCEDRGSPRLIRQQKPRVVCSCSQKEIGFPAEAWKYLQFCPSFRKPNQGPLDDTGVSTDYSRVMVNVASKDKEEACLWQKSHSPEKGLRLLHSLVWLWAGLLQLDVQALILGVSSSGCFERLEMWL